MAKQVKSRIKLLIEGGNAVPGQKIGPVLGQAGVNIGQFVQNFNEKTKDRRGVLVPTILTVYDDRTYDLEFKQPPVSFLILKALNIAKGSATANTKKVGKLAWSKVLEIAKQKLPDLNTNKLDSAANIIAGTAKSMGVEVTGK